ncbi:hypothetical protein GUITHDRAFT_150155, partial [Guillardia theta CCMP2712]
MYPSYGISIPTSVIIVNSKTQPVCNAGLLRGCHVSLKPRGINLWLGPENGCPVPPAGFMCLFGVCRPWLWPVMILICMCIAGLIGLRLLRCS